MNPFSFQIFSGLFLLFVCVYSEKSLKTQLVTMTKSELEEIVRCLSESKNQRLCDRFQICNMMMPQQIFDDPKVKTALFKCERAIDPSGQRRCNEKEKLYSSRDVFSKIFDCISQNTSKFTAEESKQMMEFETCARSLYVGNCKLMARGKKEVLELA